jgi:predicted NACHT family NTPase
MTDEFDVNAFAAEVVDKQFDRIANLWNTFWKDASHKIANLFKTTFKKYVRNTAKLHSKTKTFFIRDEPTYLYDFYVPIGIETNNKRIEAASVTEIDKLCNCAIIQGTAGCGKTTLMRHLFLDTFKSSSRVPIFVELRNLNNKKKSLSSLLRKTLRENGLSLEAKYVTAALKAGRFAILLDGMDELSEDRRTDVSDEIQSMAKKWSKNLFIVSTRPDPNVSSWNDFTTFETLPLTIIQVVELVTKLPFDKTVKSKFISDLKAGLYEEHKSFLSNPLLVSIMLLTYGQSAEVPKKLSIFFGQAFDALFQRHDAFKGGFSRQRRCSLDILEYSKVFEAFAIVTYDLNIIGMSRTVAMRSLSQAEKISGITIEKSRMLNDLLHDTCLMIEDGDMITFTHRSFQEYFSAKFICDAKDEQKRSLLGKYKERIRSDNLIKLVFEMNRDAVERYVLLPALDDLAHMVGLKKRLE